MTSQGTGHIDLSCKGCGKPRRLADVAGLAKAFGVSRAMVHRYYMREEFPRPLGVLAGAFVWDYDEAMAFLRVHRRRTGARRRDDHRP